MAPITDCMEGKTFHWTVAADKEFQAIKLKLVSAPLLLLPDFSLSFELSYDALKVGIGAVLSQQCHPITFLVKN